MSDKTILQYIAVIRNCLTGFNYFMSVCKGACVCDNSGARYTTIEYIS
jgi:hypothetical protein